jgi:hypothetical protein
MQLTTKDRHQNHKEQSGTTVCSLKFLLLNSKNHPGQNKTDHNTTQPATPPIKTAEAGQVIEKVWTFNKQNF